MVTKAKIVGLFVVSMALCAPVVWADDAGGADVSHKDGDWHHGHGEHMLAKVLNLSEIQVKQLKDSKEKQKETMKSTFDQIKSNREAFDAEIVKATPDMSKINDLQAQLKTIQGQMIDNHLNAMLEIKKILTPEQFAGYMALEKAKKMMMHHGHEKMGHHDGWGKDDHKSWSDKSDKDHGPEDQD